MNYVRIQNLIPLANDILIYQKKNMNFDLKFLAYFSFVVFYVCLELHHHEKSLEIDQECSAFESLLLLILSWTSYE